MRRAVHPRHLRAAAGRQRHDAAARPVLFRVPVCAARTLNATGQLRVTLYPCGRSTFKGQPVVHGRSKGSHTCASLHHTTVRNPPAPPAHARPGRGARAGESTRRGERRGVSPHGERRRFRTSVPLPHPRLPTQPALAHHVLISWGNIMRGAAWNNERRNVRRTPTQCTSTNTTCAGRLLSQKRWAA